ncbi:MAG TPA: TfoX/Sxy family protein [Gemmatimonadales bacterium]|nr:TfoX/Sxy family protein [Gemmatimonadales bacterium]
MSVSATFRTFVLDQLRRVDPRIRGRSMFGGVGIYAGEQFFGLIADDTLYLKVDESTRPDFVARGMGPFRPYGEEGDAMRYYALPDDVLDDAEALRPWAEKAIGVARRKPRKPPGRPGAGGTRAAQATTALGVRVKSGWATAVVLVGPVGTPRVAERHRLDLSDPRVPTSRQPYHAIMRAPARDAARLEKRLRAIVERATRRSLAPLLEHCRRAGYPVRHVALVVGSDIDPAKIGNAHIRAHALEGRLFRTVLERAVRARRVACSVVVERSLFAQAATALKRSERDLRAAVTELGHALPGPWRAEEKAATVAAWVALRPHALSVPPRRTRAT